MKKRIYIISIFIYFIFLSNSCYKGNNHNAPYQDITIPVYNGAKNIKYFSNMSIYVKSVDYTLKVDYPAKKIIDFYNKKIKELRFKDYPECDIKTNWDVFRSAMRNDYPFTRRYAQCWLDQKKEIEIFLILQYGTTSTDKWTNELSVFCQIEPFIDDKAIEEFFDKLKKEGKFGDFMSLLKKYSTSDQNVNFKKAIKENPKNQDLMEYFNLVKAYTEKLEKFKSLHK